MLNPSRLPATGGAYISRCCAPPSQTPQVSVTSPLFGAPSQPAQLLSSPLGTPQASAHEVLSPPQ
jgi:hypothetical protein